MNVTPPTRFYALTFLVNSLRDNILGGQWRGVLPPERELATQFSVSRSTLRKALRILQEDGLVSIQQGKPTLLTVPDVPKETRRFQRVVLVNCSSEQEGQGHSSSHHTILSIRDRLLRTEVDVRVAMISPNGFRGPGFHLSQMQAREASEILWVVVYPDERIEKWFAENVSESCLVVGQTDPQYGLNCIDVDQGAVGHHLGALLQKRGHNRILLAGEAPRSDRDKLFEAAFRAVGDRDAVDVEVLALRRELVAQQLPSALNRLFKASTPAIVIQSACLMVPMLYLLTKMGKQIPKDVSLVCVGTPIDLFGLPIDIAHYGQSDHKIPAAVVQQIIDAIHLPEAKLTSRLFLPDFHPGNSLKENGASLIRK